MLYHTVLMMHLTRTFYMCLYQHVARTSAWDDMRHRARESVDTHFPACYLFISRVFFFFLKPFIIECARKMDVILEMYCSKLWRKWVLFILWPFYGRSMKYQDILMSVYTVSPNPHAIVVVACHKAF